MRNEKMKRFAGKTGIVTGASSGIGAAAAKQFAAEGAKVVLAARRETEGKQIAREIRAAGGEAVFVRTDVAKADDIENLIGETVKIYGALDALETAANKIRVNNINPGIIDTEMLRRFFTPEEQPNNSFTRHTPAKRLGTPEETAAVAVWLCSDEARFVTGESILVDGGFTIPGFRV